MHKVERALAAIGRRFIGGYGSRDADYYLGRSRYRPHIGKKEAARHAGKPDGKMHLTPHEARARKWGD